MDNVDRAALYLELYNAYEKAYSDKKKQIIQSDVNKLWTEFKTKEKENDENLVKLTQAKIDTLKSIFTKKKAASILTFFRSHGNKNIQK